MTVPNTKAARHRRIVEVLEDCAATLGAREGAVARELTKHFETVRRGTLGELASALASEDPPRGEIVLLVGPPGEGISGITPEDVDARLRKALETLSVKDATAVVAAETGQPRRQVYARAVEIAAGDRHR